MDVLADKQNNRQMSSIQWVEPKGLRTELHQKHQSRTRSIQPWEDRTRNIGPRSTGSAALGPRIMGPGITEPRRLLEHAARSMRPYQGTMLDMKSWGKSIGPQEYGSKTVRASSIEPGEQGQEH